MMVALGIGDAYGGGFEYAPIDFVEQHNTLEGYVQNPKHLDLKPGCYTDDTQMSIAVAEAIISGRPWTRELLAEKFVEVYKRDPRPGYAKRFQQFLDTVKDGADFLERINPISDKSGGAMRAVPVGVYPYTTVVIERAKLQASLTHNTPEGMAAAAAAALLAHYCLYAKQVGGSLEEVGEFIANRVSGFDECVWNRPWEGAVGAKGWMSVRAAITAVSRNASLSALLKNCIAFGGDVDTVATIALGAASEHPDYAHDLPPKLLHGLEAGLYGSTFLADLDTRLKAAVP